MAFPDPFVMSTFSKESFPQFSLPFNSERWLSAASLVLAFRMILLHEFAPAFVATERRTTEAAEGEKISSKADSISLKVSKLKRKCERAPSPRLSLFVRMTVLFVDCGLIVERAL